MEERRAAFLALAFALGTGLVAVGAMWLPWFRSGAAGRNSFAIFRAAQLLGVEWVTPFRIVWFLLPVLVLGALLAFVLGFRVAAATSITLLGAVMAIAGALAWIGFGVEAGSVAATVAGLCTTVLGVLGHRA